MTETTIKPTCRTALDLPCPKCGATDCQLWLDLNSVHDEACDEVLRCENCNESFSIASVREMLAKWTRFLTWLDMMPK